MMKTLLSLIVSFALACQAVAQTVPTLPAPATASKQVDDLKLPPDSVISDDEGFVTVKAECSGEVKWLVLSPHKVKHIVVSGDMVVISVPRPDENDPIVDGVRQTTVDVFAVAYVRDHITDFVKTTITVNASGKVEPEPEPQPQPPPAAVEKPYYVTFIADLSPEKMTNNIANILNSKTIKKYVTDNGSYLSLFGNTSKNLTEKHKSIFAEFKEKPVVVIQNAAGKIKYKGVLPDSENAALNLISSVVK